VTAAASPLADLLRRLIRAQGPLGVGRYMTLALAHPEHGYYTSRDPLGAAGDFVTAPEISQLFGELLGLALAQHWLEAGRPEPAVLVELGPGRGTLLADALRATRGVPGFAAALELHLVEASPVLRARQDERLGAHAPRWHASLGTVPETGPLLLLANEFFDVLPLRQFVRRAGRWHERLVALDPAGGLAFALASLPTPLPLAEGEGAPEGAVLEVAPAREALAQEIGRRVKGGGGLALVVDYGEAGGGGGGFADTFQAVRDHRPADPLQAPGEADLTAHVDFAALARAARIGGAAAYGPVEQAAFLARLGLDLRLERLLRSATPAQAAILKAGAERITAPEEMGRLFKALALTSPGAPVPPGFEPSELFS
jgi:NADH dehydrogenase [ubiquinone] 1 alpha subcomplex assembly factor 7